MDALDDLLRSLRLEVSLVSRAVARAPWGLRIDAGPVSFFHAVVRGACVVTIDGEDPIALGLGDLVVVTDGRGHVLADADGRAPLSHDALEVVPQEGTLPLVVFGGRGEETEILCGLFRLHEGGAHASLASLLPRVVHLTASEAALATWLDANIRMLGAELDPSQVGGEAMLVRTTDLLFLRLVRACAARQSGDGGAWLRALRDPRVAGALARVHRQSTRPPTVVDLARYAGMSRSAFHARFRELLGEPPRDYVARARMGVARQLLDEHPELSTHQVAERVGYTSEDGFCRAFQRRFGESPSAYRRRTARRP